MPDVNYTIQAQVQKGSLSQQLFATGVTADIATAGMIAVTLNLNTNTTQISTALLGAVGICFARSLATITTHTVSFGRLDGTTLHETVRLKGGEAAMLRLAAGQYGARAAVAGSRLLIHVLED